MSSRRFVVLTRWGRERRSQPDARSMQLGSPDAVDAAGRPAGGD
jgi:hypothetical protein